MTRADIEQNVVSALTSVAPEVDASALDRNVPLRDQIDLDSMDVLRFMIELHKRCGVEVPEADYAKLASLAGAVDYVVARLGAPVVGTP